MRTEARAVSGRLARRCRLRRRRSAPHDACGAASTSITHPATIAIHVQHSPEPTTSEGASAVEREPFGTTPAGESVEAFTLRNPSGLEVRLMTYGGIILSIRVPDRDAQLADVTLGFDTLDEYLAGSPYFGALVGRYANRIARGRFTLDGHEYTLARNDPPNHLHGGVRGFDKVIWAAEPFGDERGAGVALSYTSPSGEEGYPGTLDVRVTYTLTDGDELAIDYHATTDAPTPINLSQHTYFDLGGDDSPDILGHRLTLAASRFTPVDATLIPTGELRAVAGTPFDFTTPVAIGARIGATDEQLRLAGGYDHDFVLDRPPGDALFIAARLEHPPSGRVLEIATTEPGIQFYSGNQLDGSLVGKRGRRYGRHSGLALETQHFPDSPNHPSFPSTILHPGEEYRSRTVWKFATAD
jgi:aldose 1-epimerase